MENNALPKSRPPLFSLRWRKAWRDLWRQKTRTLLVILSIAVGLFTFGMILGARNLITTELPVQYLSAHPAAATLHTTLFDDAMVAAVEHMPEIAAADGRFAATVRYLNAAGEWHDLKLYALDDYEGSRVDIVRPWRGAWPPSDHQILLERNSLSQTGLTLGDNLLLEMSDGEQRSLPIAGLTHDMNQAPAQITGVPYGYVNANSLEWLGYPRRFNELHLLVAERPFDKAHIQAVAKRVADKLERDGEIVYWVQVPDPGKHFVQEFLPTITLIMSFIGFLALLLSVLLAINVIVAILLQQRRQIGVMKAVGGRASQVAGIYLRMVILFGLGALVLAVPLSILGAHAFSRFIAGQINFDLDRIRVVPSILFIQIVVGLLVPLAAALFPILSGTRVTVREAIQDYGLEGQSFEQSHAERALIRLQERLGVSRPVRLSLRNVFRRKGRLARTLLALVLSGAMFMTVWSVRGSLFLTLEETLAEQGADIQVQLSRPERVAELDEALAGTPGLAALEYWTVRQGILLRPDGTEGDSLIVNALPVNSQQFNPAINDGRWLEPGERAVVVPEALLQTEPGLALGGDLIMRIGDEETTWRIVGVRRAFQPPIVPSAVYVAAEEFGRVIGPRGRADTLRITTTDKDAATQSATLAAVETRLAGAGFDIRSSRTGSEDRRVFNERFNILTVILLVMAFLLATVGGLGLMGTMSINVLERRREIGVMRAIGASNGAVMRLVVIEGVAIGVMSWAGALILAQPMSRLLSYEVGMNFVKTPLKYIFDWRAPLMWIVLVIAIATLSSLLPAWSAARLSVRETLAYE